MKRLTYNLKVGDIESWTVEGADNLTCDEICKRQEDDGCRTCPIEKMYNRLAQIENILGDDYDLDCLNELVKADREERCVILPVKIGDFVYMPLLGKILRLELIEISMTNYITIFKGVHGKLIFLFNEEDIGKDVFLTRKEAEQALK